jgi:tetratricopeptide (TPR) repeat protein
MTMAMEGIHPVARLCAARGIAYDAISNPHRAVQFLRAAMTIDPRCVEALDYAVKSRLLTPEEEREWISGLKFGDGKYGTADDKERGGYWSSMGMSWLRDAYLARLHGIGGLDAPNLPSDSLQGQSVDQTAANIMSPVPRSDLQSPSMLSLGSPDFAGGDVGRDANEPLATLFASSDKAAVAAAKASGISLTVDGAFRNLAIKHNLGRSPDILSHAAIRSYALHDLHSALAYCTAIDSIDPYCRTAGYVHVATLVGLNLKRRLFQLAHRLVDTDPKDSLAWFAVGSYYYACRRYDLAQRHFSRSTRLDPRSTECWIGFGCSFAVCDESDQALASFRAAQNKNSGSHVPLLYMGMEYLRTNHLSLAGHFLNSAQRTDPCDMLCCNELGVWCYRQGNLVDAAFWFMKALRLHARTESTVLSSTDEGLGMNGYILLTGQSGKWGGRTYTAVVNEDASTPYFKRRSSGVSTVLCALKTPSGQSIAASSFGDNINVDNDALSDMECIDRCMDQFWEPTIFNLGQSYRKMNRYGDAIVCFEKCSSLNPVSSSLFANKVTSTLSCLSSDFFSMLPLNIRRGITPHMLP